MTEPKDPAMIAATQQPAERARTWWFLENHDGEWLENEPHGDFTRDPNKALKWPNAQAADQARNQMRMSLWAALKSEPTAHRWVSPATQQPAGEGVLRRALEKIASGFAECDGFQDAQAIATEALSATQQPVSEGVES